MSASDRIGRSRGAKKRKFVAPKPMAEREKRLLKFSNRIVDAKRKKRTTQNRDYDVEDVRGCLRKMVQGWSVRRASKLSNENGARVPRATLIDLYKSLFGKKPNSLHKIALSRQTQMLSKIEEFELPSHGRGFFFTKDEEEMIVAALELAYERAFPWDQENLVALVTTMLAKMPKHKGKVPSRGWIRRFESRWAHRLDKIKAGALGPDRAKQATEEVRDEVYGKFVVMLQDLKGRGLFTQDQIDHIEDHIINADEVGGNEKGNRRRVYKPRGGKKARKGKKGKKQKQWRNVEVGDDKNPFHSSTMLVTQGNGEVKFIDTHFALLLTYLFFL